MDQRQLLKSFSERTGANDTEGRKYLEESDWDVELALALFLSKRPSSNMNDPPSLFPQRAKLSPEAQASNKAKTVPPPKRTGIASLSDFSSQNDDDENTEKWYTGGDKSGLQVQAPKKTEDIKNSVFESAKRMGATAAESTNNSFGGSAYRLGTVSQPKSEVKAPDTPKRKEIIFWKNGFSIDDGPLRTFDDPKNVQFMDYIKRGEVPPELDTGVVEVDIGMIDKHTEDYVPPPMKPFEGAGNKLGGVSSSTTSVSTEDQPFTLDQGKPVTSIQIRLSDGTRLIGKFNTDHRVHHIRTFINQSKGGNRAYSLLTSFPQKVISDESITIQEAGLANSVVIQKA